MRTIYVIRVWIFARNVFLIGPSISACTQYVRDIANSCMRHIYLRRMGHNITSLKQNTCMHAYTAVRAKIIYTVNARIVRSPHAHSIPTKLRRVRRVHACVFGQKMGSKGVSLKGFSSYTILTM